MAISRKGFGHQLTERDAPLKPPIRESLQERSPNLGPDSSGAGPSRPIEPSMAGPIPAEGPEALSQGYQEVPVAQFQADVFESSPIETPSGESSRLQAAALQAPPLEPILGSAAQAPPQEPMPEPIEEAWGRPALAEADSPSGQSRKAPAPGLEALVTTVVLSLALSPDSDRRPDSLSLKVLLVPPAVPGAPWSLPAAGARDPHALEMAACQAAGLPDKPGGLWIEPLGAFPAGPSQSPGLSLAYMALIDPASLKAGQESGGRRWISVNPLWAENAIFLEGRGFKGAITLARLSQKRGRVKDSRYEAAGSPLAYGQAEALLRALEMLKDSLETSDRVFNLLPEVFSLAHLQKLFETLLGSSVQAPAFRRKAAQRLKPTDQFTRDKRFRPPRLFKYNPDWRQAKNQV
ncbi:MAG: hypothetical protein LBE49_08050 [Deltaproteobacteria bacterium]|jgi:ADP-ribose pyrophosphatase YjhB (NUDIX family)|nr:hypothetical protein [Deltaproteobacteria bacterium]